MSGVLALVMLAGATPFAASASGSDQTTTTVYALTPPGRHAGGVRFRVYLPPSVKATIMFVGSRKVPGGRHAGNTIFGEAGPDVSPTVYADGKRVDCADGQPLCSPAPGGGGTVGTGDTDPRLDLWLVAIRAREFKFVLLTSGWHVQRVDSRLFRTADSRAGGATGVTANGNAVERFTNAELPGGRHGSFAVAHPPCEMAGAGSVTLTGGASDWTLACAPVAYLFKVEQASRATRWRLRGDMVGETEGTIRLAVLDQPDPATCRCG